MKTAIVILNWNGQDMLSQYLPIVLDYSRDDAQVIVADNASTDASLDMLRQRFPEVSIIRLDQNYGFAGGYNHALKQVDADYYVLLNSDVEVTHHWLTPLIEFMDYHRECAACQPKILSMRDKDYFEYAGASGGFIDRLGYPFCRGRLLGSIERDNGQYDYRTQVFWATGACMMIRAKDFWAAGAFDERFFAHQEEIDLCWRLQLQGHTIFCLPESEVYHVGGGTLPQGNPRKTYLNFRNNLTMLYKNLPIPELKYVMRMRWLLDHAAACKALLVDRNWQECKAILKARHDFRKWKQNLTTDRKRAGASLTNSQLTGRKHYSLLWQYYIKGTRAYKDLPDD